MQFDPWNVDGDIDYNKLVKEFGIEPMKELPQVFRDNVLFRRNVVFAHRDFGRILARIRDEKPFVMMTGLMPTGKMHIGHMLVVQQMRFYQSLGAKLYICVADVEAYHARGISLNEARRIAVEEYLLNYIALGLEPDNVDVYFQSDRSVDGAKGGAFCRLQDLLGRAATFSEFMAVYGEVSPGKMISAVLQASDILHAQLPEFEGKVPVVVPVGIDQDPHLRLTRDMAKRIKEYSLIAPASTYHLFMPGLGGGKMSASKPESHVALTDTPKQAERKINKYAFSGGQPSVEEHREKGGDPDVDVSFQYLKYWFEPDDETLQQLHDDYKSGRLLTGELKKHLIGKLKPFLEDLATKRESARDRVSEFLPNGKI